MKTFKVINPEGMIMDGKKPEKGHTFHAEPSGQIRAWLHFQQVEEVKEETPENKEKGGKK